jgi:hypothetical protein
MYSANFHVSCYCLNIIKHKEKTVKEAPMEKTEKMENFAEKMYVIAMETQKRILAEEETKKEKEKNECEKQAKEYFALKLHKIKEEAEKGYFEYYLDVSMFTSSVKNKIIELIKSYGFELLYVREDNHLPINKIIINWDKK